QPFLWPSEIPAGPSVSKRRRISSSPSPKFPNFSSRSHECPECGKTFACLSHFSKHRRTHTG
ncbi:ZN189 protein, partial [Certhia familiaris]|nr:ZN189 protein [Certhia familiaris]